MKPEAQSTESSKCRQFSLKYCVVVNGAQQLRYRYRYIQSGRCWWNRVTVESTWRTNGRRNDSRIVYVWWEKCCGEARRGMVQLVLSFGPKLITKEDWDESCRENKKQKEKSKSMNVIVKMKTKIKGSKEKDEWKCRLTHNSGRVTQICVFNPYPANVLKMVNS